LQGIEEERLISLQSITSSSPRIKVAVGQISLFLIDQIFAKNRLLPFRKVLKTYMRGYQTFHKMSESCADSGSFSKMERASRSRIRTRICANRSTSWDRCFEMAPLRSRNSPRRDSTDAISRFLDDNMNKWYTIDILNITISDQELEQVRVELPLVRSFTIDRTVGFIYYNSTFHLNTFKYGMENMASLLIRAFEDDYADFHDEPNNISRGIFRAYINGCTKLFYKIAPGVDKTRALPLAKFVAIAISFKPDRALFAYKNCDQMWVKFVSEFEDLFFYEHFIDDSFASAVPYLFNLRDLFNVYFRDGRFELIDMKSKED